MLKLKLQVPQTLKQTGKLTILPAKSLVRQKALNLKLHGIQQPSQL
jgi:hypothetical protein